MRNYLRTRLHLLRGNAGEFDTNFKELALSQPLSLKVLAAAVTLVLGVYTLVFALNASATASVRFNAADLEFSKDVRASSLVRGYGDNRIALLIDTDGECTIKQWYAATLDGTPALRSSKTLTTGACAASTEIPAETAGSVRGVDLKTIKFTYENLGGRPITFDSAGNTALATASKPSDVLDDDWNDPRPYRVELQLQSAKADLAKFSKQATLVGTTAVVNVPKASNVHYVPPTTPVITPASIRIASIVRSNTTGTIYSGGREGITVTILGGTCDNGPTTLVTSYTPEGPSGLAPVNAVATAQLTGGAAPLELGGVPNGTTGAVKVVASCGVGSMTIDTSANYHQDVPAPQLTVKQGSSAEQYILTWTAVSSLAATYGPEYDSNFGYSNDMPETTALTATQTFPTGTTYGGTVTFWVFATVNGEVVKSAPAAVSTAWPATPAGANMTYTRTGYNGNYASGNVKWNFTGTCPAGTTLQASQLENHAGTTSKTYNNAVQYQGPWTANLTQVNWGPSYALQGYPYGMGLQTRCASPSGFYSPVVQVQSREWITPMAQPAAPVWNAYNIYTYTAPVYWTHSTCNAPSGCATLAVNYITYCPAGSNLNSNGWMSTDWGGGQYWHNFGFGDYWQLPNAVARNVTYTNAQYNCATPWGYVTPMSPVGAGVTVTVFP